LEGIISVQRTPAWPELAQLFGWLAGWMFAVGEWIYLYTAQIAVL